MRRAALLRPMALLMVVIGAFFFVATRELWIVPLTLTTYAALVLLAIGDPIFQNRVLGTTEQGQRIPQAPQHPHSSPEQRARRLPRGASRLRVERALEAHARVLAAVEMSDEATQAALDDALPKLRQVPELLLDVTEAREKAAAEAQTLRSRTARSGNERGSRALASLEEKLRAADEGLLATIPDDLLALRAKVVRASIEDGDAAAERATELDEALDALNRRLDALCSTLSAPAER
ncbi:MAG TPA: hypothetical protein VKA51_07195 [Rubrobacteraceae bacterium]|nr:hypothetical protein [Rubrobacteraceae bacterium]